MTAAMARSEPAVLYPHRPKVRHRSGWVWIATCPFPACTWFAVAAWEYAVEDAVRHATSCRIDLAAKHPIRRPDLRVEYGDAACGRQPVAVTVCLDCGDALHAEPANDAGELPDAPEPVDHQCLAIPRQWVPYPELVDELGGTWTLYWSGPIYSSPGPWYASPTKAVHRPLDSLERDYGPLTLPGFPHAGRPRPPR